MNADDLHEVLNRATETLTTELKSWIDPAADEDIEKIAIACMTLRNQDGGVVIFGYNDDGSPCTAPDVDVRKAYERDVLQGLVSKYAHSPLEIEIHFVERKGHEYPVVVVPAGDAHQ